MRGKRFTAHLHTPWLAYHRYLKGRSSKRLPQYCDHNNPTRVITPSDFLTAFASLHTPSTAPDGSPTAAPIHHAPRGHTAAQRRSQQHWAEPFTPAEVTLAILQTPANKAAGPDGLSPNIFRRATDILLHPLTVLFNRYKTEHTFPPEWKAGDGILLPKVGRENLERFSVKDFRLIVLYPVLGKIFKGLLLNRLQLYRVWMRSGKTPINMDLPKIAAVTQRYFGSLTQSKTDWETASKRQRCFWTWQGLSTMCLTRTCLRRWKPLLYPLILCS